MTLYAAPLQPGAYPSFRPANTPDVQPVGSIVLAAARPSPRYLLMDNATQYNMNNYPRMSIAGLDPAHIAFNSVLAAQQIALSSLDTSATLSQVLAVAPNQIALSDGSWNTAGNQQTWSTDNGASWHEQIPSAQWGASVTTQINKVLQTYSGRSIIYHGSTNSLLRYDALGTFASTTLTSATAIADLDTDGSTTIVVAAFQSGTSVLRKSTDNGVSYSAAGITGPNGTMTAAVQNICWTGQYWIAQQNNLWYRSTDLATWSAMASVTLVGACSIASDDNGVVVVVNAGNFQRSADHGATWSASAAISNYSAVTITQALNLVHDGSGNFVYLKGNVYSQDGGQTWLALPAITFTGNITSFMLLRGYGIWVKRTDGVVQYTPGRSFFLLIPPNDWNSRLPSRYYMKAY